MGEIWQKRLHFYNHKTVTGSFTLKQKMDFHFQDFNKYQGTGAGAGARVTRRMLK